MSSTRHKRYRPGAVYRTRDLRRWARNPTRLARDSVAGGELVRLAGGLYACPRKSKFGALPPSDEAIMKAFLDGAPFVFTGPERWNQLGLGSTARFASRLVYNTKRSGEFLFGNKRFVLRRVRFPRRPSPEWFVVDLLEHHGMAGVDLDLLKKNLVGALRLDRFDPDELVRMARRYGSKATQALVGRVIAAAEAAS
jgi:hypothetical protein